jgi:hypothetical protein
MSEPPPIAHAAAPPAASRKRAPAMVRGYLGASSGWRRLGGWLQAAFDGVWLGLLHPDHLHAIDEHFYDGNRTYHSDAHNQRGLFPWEEAALEQSFASCRRLLVIAAGGGREVLTLSQRGYEVVGYECNQGLVDYAAEFLPRQGCAAPVHPLPRGEVPPATEPFDGVILGWGAYTLMPGSASRIDFLRRLRPLMVEGAPILLSFYSREERHERRMRASAAVANGARALLRRARAEVGDALQPNFFHYFTSAEIARELREAGFEPDRYRPSGTGVRDSGWAVGLARPLTGG